MNIPLYRSVIGKKKAYEYMEIIRVSKFHIGSRLDPVLELTPECVLQTKKHYSVAAVK